MTNSHQRNIDQFPIFQYVEKFLKGFLFSFFIENDLISQNQSGFKPGESCINQLLSITHEIYK